jgi:hypothetical protein
MAPKGEVGYPFPVVRRRARGRDVVLDLVRVTPP